MVRRWSRKQTTDEIRQTPDEIKKNPDEIRQTRDEIRQTPDAKIKSTGGAYSCETAVTQSMPRDGRKIPVYISDITLRQLAEAYRRA